MRNEGNTMSRDEKIAEKMKRFDDVFRMLLLVMTITTSIGLSTYEGLSLTAALVYLVMALFFWMLGHFFGSNPLFRDFEILSKINGWVIAFLVTATTFAKFALNRSILDLAPKLIIFFTAGALALMTYLWFESYILPETRRRYMLATMTIIVFSLTGSFSL